MGRIHSRINSAWERSKFRSWQDFFEIGEINQNQISERTVISTLSTSLNKVKLAPWTGYWNIQGLTHRLLIYNSILLTVIACSEPAMAVNTKDAHAMASEIIIQICRNDEHDSMCRIIGPPTFMASPTSLNIRPDSNDIHRKLIQYTIVFWESPPGSTLCSRYYSYI